MNKNSKIAIWIISLFVIFSVVVLALSNKGSIKTSPASNNKIATKPTQTTTKAIKETTIKIGSTGDILIHSPIFRSAYNSNSDTYDFNYIFSKVKSTYESYDFMVADLEQPLAGKAAGYSGFPLFNAPDSIANALKNNGVDMLLTANNHCYDQGESGFLRTQQVIKDIGIDHIGTISNINEKPFIVKDIKGIKVGMINYTYETEALSDTKYLNGIPMNSNTAKLVNSFNYNNLEAFYNEFQNNLDNMYKVGAEVIIAYMHWGEEYSLSANDYQKKIAQKLCDMGVDAIVGGHTHCIEPIDMLSSDISGKQTPVIYSTGNQLSNQRKETLNKFSYSSPYFEDGVIFELSFTKKSDGSVVCSDVSYTASWCNLFGSKYYIIPLNKSYKTDFASLNRTSEMSASLKRTKGLLDKGIKKIKAEYKQIDLRKKQ